MSLEEMKSIELEMLIHIDKFCKEHNICYSLCGGTLLGAIRHQGFIPWDDDIDIFMPRPDYQRFIALYNNFHPRFTLQNIYNDDSYYFLHSKVYDNRTVLVESSACNGVFIDIFPIDGLPEYSECQKYYDRMMCLVHRLAKTSKVYKYKENFLYHYISYGLKRIIYPSRKKIICQLDEMFSQYPFYESQYAGAIVARRYRLKEHMESSIFKQYSSVKFEGHFFSVIKEYDVYLRNIYGNYMDLPPVEKRVSHHNFVVYWK